MIMSTDTNEGSPAWCRRSLFVVNLKGTSTNMAQNKLTEIHKQFLADAKEMDCYDSLVKAVSTMDTQLGMDKHQATIKAIGWALEAGFIDSGEVDAARAEVQAFAV